jgi:hypothetical protein
MKTRLAVVALAAAVTALTSCSSGSAGPASPPATSTPLASVTAAGTVTTAPSTVTASTVTASTVTASTVTASTVAATTGAGTTAAGAVTYGARGLVPLWPFTTAAQVRTWQRAYRSGGSQPWHLDPGGTALAFTRSHLGYTDVDRVSSLVTSGGDARVGVGWSDPEVRLSTVAVLHLIRYGVGADAPWVVVGSADTNLTLATPRYGSTVSSPLRVGGVISGVDESLRVAVLGPTSSVPLAVVQGLPAGGERTPWTTTLRFNAPSGAVLTVAVSTGGHLKGVERFAITAVRVR